MIRVYGLVNDGKLSPPKKMKGRRLERDPHGTQMLEKVDSV